MTRHANPRQDRSEVVAADVGRRRRLSSSAPALHQATRAPGRADQRGSALILVIVCLVMMVLMGTAYIQIARVDRRATAQLTAVDNMATVRDAVIAYLKQVLREDLIMTDAGGFFDPAAYQEDFDSPFTNYAGGVNFPVTRGVAIGTGAGQLVGDPLGTAVGGRFDDMWLASTVIEAETAPGWGSYGDPATVGDAWSHISNLNGVFLTLPAVGGGATVPTEAATGAPGSSDHDGLGAAGPYAGQTSAAINGGVLLSGSNQSGLGFTPGGYEKKGVDTDGDGIDDARWTWAPESVRQIGGSAYVVAYRIIDLSSMADVNVGTSLAGDRYTLPTDVRGYAPTDAWVGRLIQMRGNLGTWNSEYLGLHTQRGLSATLPLPAGAATLTGLTPFAGNNSRGGAWFDSAFGARYYGFTTNEFGVDDELEMRARGGLNTATVTPLENRMPNALRRDSLPTTEATYSGVPGAGGNVQYYMNGVANHPWASNNTISGTNRTTPAIRHVVTTMSGSSILAPRYPGMTGGISADERLQVDLVYRHAGSAASRISMFNEKLRTIFKVGTPKYLGLSDDALLDKIAGEFAVAIHDYSDEDNKPQQITVGGVNYYGMEMLPFLREFYIQARYKAADADAADMDYEEWQYEVNTAGFIVEIGNPFDKAIKFSGTNAPSIRLRIVQGAVERIAPYVLPADLPDLPARNPSAGADDVTEQMVLFSNPQDATQLEGGKGGNIITDLGVESRYTNATFRKDIGAGLLTDGFTYTEDFTVELQVQVPSGGYVTYDRLTASGLQIKDKFTTASGAVVSPDPRAHAQLSVYRDGQKHRYISNKGKPATANKRDPDTTGYKLNNTTVSKLGYDNKGASGDTELDKIQLAHSNHRIFNVCELGYIFMLGFFDGANGDIPARISGADGNLSTDSAVKSRWFLSLGDSTNNSIMPSPAQIVIPNGTKIPHMAMVFDSFTVYSPRFDGVDNDDEDGDGIAGVADNEAEQFVPGYMNINTVPMWLFGMIAPLPEQLANNDFNANMEQISLMVGFYRDRPGNGGRQRALPLNDATLTTNARNTVEADKGLRSLGELLLMGYTSYAPYDMLIYGRDNTAIGTTDVKRLYPHPNDSSASKYSEEYPVQERFSRFHFLKSLFSTRSDRYCAYVVIREYNSAAFNQAPSNALRFYVLLDRSRVVDTQSQVIATPKTGQKN